MFDSLEEKMKHDADVEVTRKERIIKGLMVAVLSVLLFGGLYFVVRILE